MQQKYFSASSLSSSGFSHVGSLPTNAEQKGLAHDVMYTSATNASSVHDVIDFELG